MPDIPPGNPPDAARPTVQTLDDLVPLVYKQLRNVAQRYMRRERKDHTLSATGLVHEAYLRLRKGSAACEDRARFFAAAGQAMRQILIDHAKRRGRKKRIGARRRILLHEGLTWIAAPDADVLALDTALIKLAATNPDLAALVELRFFAGLSIEHTAEALGVSTATVERNWRAARAFLAAEFDADSRASPA